jgi:predicted RNA-binding protein associated with RNAse of E/G family
MNGPQHYRFSEKLLMAAVSNEELTPADIDQAIAMANVHAILALTAAHVDTRGNGFKAYESAWTEALS